MTDELQSRDLDWLAATVGSHFRALGYQVTRDVALWDGSSTVMMRARKGADDLLVELRQRPDLPPFLQQLVDQAIARREPAMLAVAVAAPMDDDDDLGTIAIASLRSLRERGVGLLQASDGGVVEIERAVAFSARVTLPPELKHDAEAGTAVVKFNRGDPLDGLRDISTHVEQMVRRVAERAVSFGVVNCDAPTLAATDFNGMIDLLGTPTYKKLPQACILESALRNDLHSFRSGGRNVVQHPVRTRAARQKRDRQLTERMITGLRLVTDLASVRVPKKRP